MHLEKLASVWLSFQLGVKCVNCEFPNDSAGARYRAWLLHSVLIDESWRWPLFASRCLELTDLQVNVVVEVIETLRHIDMHLFKSCLPVACSLSLCLSEITQSCVDWPHLIAAILGWVLISAILGGYPAIASIPGSFPLFNAGKLLILFSIAAGFLLSSLIYAATSLPLDDFAAWTSRTKTAVSE